jgi:hypothetical protein
MQAEFERCVLRAEDAGNRTLSGRVRLELLIRRSGNVYAAFVWSEHGIDDRKFERCLTNSAPLWVFPPVAVDYQRAYSTTFISSGSAISTDLHSGAGLTGNGRASVMLPDINELPEPTPINVNVARETLDLAEWATQGERAYAETVLQLYPQAIQHAREALATDPSDPIALRALSQALIESHGDAVEARKLAERLVSIDPQSVQGHEALLRVCLATQDDRCAFEEWDKARTAPDLVPRSRLLQALHGPTQLAVERLKRKVAQARSAAAAEANARPVDQPAAPPDPCAVEQGEEAQALCVVKRCLDQGSADYAKELSSQNGLPYAAGDWRAKKVAAGKLLVTRPIELVPPTSGEPGPQGPRHDALWLVMGSGDQLLMRPSNTEAHQITLRHNRCTARVVTGK